jgi:valine--pyruvate aminotransferase
MAARRRSSIYLTFSPGEFSDGGARKKILLPLTPEYIGYADVGLDEDIFVSYRPEIDHLRRAVCSSIVWTSTPCAVTDEVGAICVSRPTNPTGNVLTDEEIARLHASWQSTTDVPLIIDNAYGPPFPGILYK